MGGHVKNPDYRDVCGGKTGHAEVVQIVYDPSKITYEKLLEWFWKLHDPIMFNNRETILVLNIVQLFSFIQKSKD